MGVEENASRVRIVAKSQHPLNHAAAEIAFSHKSMPGVRNLQDAFYWMCAVIYPQAKDPVATPADLPVGATLNDYRIVLDDGDGRAAGYRYFALEGGSPSWRKVGDFDWNSDGIISGFYQKTLEMYVSKFGYDDLDENGDPLTGFDAGQSIYGGRTPDGNLTFYANAGDDVGPRTGFIQFGDKVRPYSDGVFDFGEDETRWRKLWAGEGHFGTMEISGGSIVDSSGAISFDANDLVTDGAVHAGYFTALDGSPDAPAYSFFNEPDTGLYLAAAGRLGVSVGDSDVAAFDSWGLDLIAGDAAHPALVFDGASGLYGDGDDVLVGTSGTERVRFRSNGDVNVQDLFYLGVVGGGLLGINTVSPLAQLHAVADDFSSAVRLETHADSAATGSMVLFQRSHDSEANCVLDDSVGRLDFYARASSAYSIIARQEVLYTGDGSSVNGDIVWSTSHVGAFAERMRLTHDGLLGLGVAVPGAALHVSGNVLFNSILFGTSTISTKAATDSDLTLSADGTGLVRFGKGLQPTSDNALDIGATAKRAKDLYLSGSVSDGTNAVALATLLSFRSALSGAASGMTLFFNSGTGLWTASLPDTEVDHGSISGLTDDDHGQYALLAGRGGSQTLVGGVTSAADLYLVSTSHGTKGNVFFTGDLAPTSDDTYDIGGSGADFRNLYLSGQAFGLRVENYSTVGRPGANAGTKGRLYYDTTTEDVMVDHGGTWFKASIDLCYIEDATNWAAGTTKEWTYDVSAYVTDSRRCVWTFKSNTGNYLQMAPDISSPDATHVKVAFGINQSAGTYTLVGVG